MCGGLRVWGVTKAGDVWRGWKPILVWRGVEFHHLENSESCGDDVMREVSNEGHILIAQGVVEHEGIKVRAWGYGDLTTGTAKVCYDCIFLLTLSCRKIYVAKGGRASAR